MKLIVFILILSGCMIYIGCEGYGDHGPTFSGRITFNSTDTILTPVTGGSFIIAFFEGNPEDIKNSEPSYKSYLAPRWSGSGYYADFRLGPLRATSYYAAVMWESDNYTTGEIRPVLGVFGCNTDPLCTNYQHASGNVGFSANGDTINKLFYNIVQPH